VRAFLAGAKPVEFAAKGRKEVYTWVDRVLVPYEYARQGKVAKGLLRRYISKMTGLSRPQVSG
ncbi:MAG: integrase, partial [Bryobacteraceae bacterium]